MDEENSSNENEEEYETYFAAREHDEETEDEMSFDSIVESTHSSDNSSESSDQNLEAEEQSTTNDEQRVSYDRNSPAYHSYLDNEFEELTDRVVLEEESSDQNLEAEEQSNTNDERRVSYDRSLPAYHSYLGNDFEELTGRVVLEKETIITIPLLCLPKVVLIPGQILPLQFHGSYFLHTIKSIIEGNKIFGLVPNYIHNNGSLKNIYNNVKLDRLGTIVEVRSYGTENNGSILKIKAEGKERFIIKETWTESNRTVMGKVFILPEIDMKHPFHKDIGLSSRGGSRFNKRLLCASTPYPSFAYELYNEEYLMDKIRGHLNEWASFSTNSKKSTNESSETEQRRNVYENRTVQQATGTNQPAQTNNEQTGQQSSEVSRVSTTESSTTDVQPVSVNTTRTVVTRIVPVNDSDEDEDEEEDDSEGNGFKAYAPSTALEFSYWVLANLPLEDHQRLILLSLNSPIQRLRWEASFFEKYLSLICIYCSAHICNCEDIFSMSVNGYQEIFVNTHGFLHDTLTVSKVRDENISLQGEKVSEYCWFPNYSWIVMCCSQCDSHLGWKFVANNKKLNPQHFFGISRSNLRPGIDNVNDSTDNSNPLI